MSTQGKFDKWFDKCMRGMGWFAIYFWLLVCLSGSIGGWMTKTRVDRSDVDGIAVMGLVLLALCPKKDKKE